MTRKEILEVLVLLSNLESVIDMRVFKTECPEWLADRLEEVVTMLSSKLD